MLGSFVVAGVENLKELLEYENKKLKELYPSSRDSDLEMSMIRWNSRWREESLEHYLKLGWSFILRDSRTSISPEADGNIMGYFLAQPLLFFDGQTQSLWIEYMSFSNALARDHLCEMAYKLSRDKHMQKVYFPSQNSVLDSVNSYNPTSWKPEVVQILTTRMMS